MSLMTTKLEDVSDTDRSQWIEEKRNHYQNQVSKLNATHLAILISSSSERSVMWRFHGGESSVCMEINKATVCDPISTASTAKGSEAKPNRRATSGDWSTYVCYQAKTSSKFWDSI